MGADFDGQEIVEGPISLRDSLCAGHISNRGEHNRFSGMLVAYMRVFLFYFF